MWLKILVNIVTLGIPPIIEAIAKARRLKREQEARLKKEREEDARLKREAAIESAMTAKTPPRKAPKPESVFAKKEPK
jgi:hypothetical protein